MGLGYDPDIPAGCIRVSLTDGARVAADTNAGRPNDRVLHPGTPGRPFCEGLNRDRRADELFVSCEGN